MGSLIWFSFLYQPKHFVDGGAVPTGLTNIYVEYFLSPDHHTMAIAKNKVCGLHDIYWYPATILVSNRNSIQLRYWQYSTDNHRYWRQYSPATINYRCQLSHGYLVKILTGIRQDTSYLIGNHRVIDL
ncbi:hypothetical protein L484_018692 [Morus notabilis]|uniref:Uncharacterized protein n=1 Tax=Morus notabilis TaxID=981085 RepID=W9S7A8_9ROSA|nr:hypothetical protein L484_018692 [Morus notabilis]